MSQKQINVGTVANDGTGDTLRGAFTNVNANFTEVYSNISTLSSAVASIDSGQNTAISSAYNTANASFGVANTANALAYNVATNANLYSTAVGTSGNAYTTSVGTAGNNYTNAVGVAGNAYTTLVGTSGNSYTTTVGVAGNAYTTLVGTSGNAYTLSIATAGNNYASILAANNAAGANDWSNNLTTVTYSWANSKFDTVTNTSLILNMANAAYIRANNSLANTANASNGFVTLIGSLTVTGLLSDAIGSVREKRSNTIVSNYTVQTSQSNIIANNSNTIFIRIPDDNNFSLPANIGTSIDVYQFGSGNTKIVANDVSVTVYSSNNWANIAGQYLTASVTKVLSNTWILTGNLRA